MRIAFRGYVDGALRFEETVAVDDGGFDVEALALKHAADLGDDGLFMIEIEFLDEPDPLQRFMRFGTDPRGMRVPVAVSTQSVH